MKTSNEHLIDALGEIRTIAEKVLDGKESSHLLAGFAWALAELTLSDIKGTPTTTEEETLRKFSIFNELADALEKALKVIEVECVECYSQTYVDGKKVLAKVKGDPQ